jgi:ABC-2 type transport system ATP-binding protein
MNFIPTVQIATIVVLPLLITAAAMRRFRITWTVLALGVLFYLAQAGLQAAFLAAVLTSNLMHSPAALAASLALLFGAFEEGGRWLGFIGTDTMQRYRNWGAVVVYGAGHGAAAAARLMMLAAIIPALAAPIANPSLAASAALAFAVVPEIIFQCGWSTLVMYAVIRRRARYLLVAIVGHVALYDAVFTMLQQGRIGIALLIEITAALAAAAAASYLYFRWPFRQHEGAERSALHSGAAIALHDLAFTYPADLGHEPVQALHGLTLEVRRGQVLALLGHNGAGKTTTLHILSGLLTPSSGHASIEGHDVEEQPDEVRKLVGFQRDEPGLYPYMPVAAYLNFFARLYDIPRDERGRRIDHLLDILQLADKRDAACGSLSKGSRQKVAFARTLIHEPQVLLLDEPTSGLDPVISMLVREMIGRLKQQGRTLVLATHNLYEAEAIADDVAIVHHGRLIRHGAVSALEGDGVKRFILRLHATEDSLARALERLHQLDSITDLRLVDDESNGAGQRALSFCTTAPESTNPEVLSIALAMGLKPYALVETILSLERLYLDLDRELSDENGTSAGVRPGTHPGAHPGTHR